MVHNPSIPLKIKSIQRKTLRAKRFQGFFIFTLLPNNAVLSTLIVGLSVGDFIRDRFYGRQKEEYFLTEVYAEHNEKCRALIGKEFSESTVEKFETSLSHIKEFLRKEYHTKDILLFEVNNKFIGKFDFFLKTTKNCKQNSAIKHLKNLKKIIRIALANEWIKKDPFVGIQFKLEETNPQFLTQEELDKLQAKELTIVRLEQVRDQEFLEDFEIFTLVKKDLINTVLSIRSEYV